MTIQPAYLTIGILNNQNNCITSNYQSIKFQKSFVENFSTEHDRIQRPWGIESTMAMKMYRIRKKKDAVLYREGK